MMIIMIIITIMIVTIIAPTLQEDQGKKATAVASFKDPPPVKDLAKKALRNFKFVFPEAQASLALWHLLVDEILVITSFLFHFPSPTILQFGCLSCLLNKIYMWLNKI